MKIYEIDGIRYRLGNDLSDFQLRMYVHLINWKWTNLTREPGFYNNDPYDALLPEEFKAQLHPLYRPVYERFQDHQCRFPFKIHRFFEHMASSQAACSNLFLPLLQDPMIAARVLGAVKTDLKKIATDYLDKGFRLEFWDEPDNVLNDHNRATGTDADIAIAYYDQQGDLALWLIEHKLSEPEFTTCGGFKSPKRTSPYVCSPASAILDNNDLCYYHGRCGYRYWDITLQPNSPFDADRIRKYQVCPFMGGMNQLWRNQLLATALESSSSPDWPYKKVYFSVVHHPRNDSLIPTISEYQKLLGFNDRFFAFSSEKLINRAIEINDPGMNEWVQWYQQLYYF